MKTLLIATHQISFSDQESLYNCMGVLTLSAALKQAGLKCEILDLIDYHHLGQKDPEATLGSITSKILEHSPDILGFSTMSNNTAIALDLAARVKKMHPGIHIVLGGPGTAFCADEVLKNFVQVDVIFRGEVDFIFAQYVLALQERNLQKAKSLPGLIYREAVQNELTGNLSIKRGQKQKSVLNANPDKFIIKDNGWPELITNLDELPFPDYPFTKESFIKQTETKFGDYNGVSIESGRGCPYKCTFCSTSVYFKRKVRLKSPDRVIQEIGILQKHLGKTRIIFNHDLFTLKRKHVLEICGKLKKEYPDLIWKCHARLDSLDEELIRTMNEAGCNEMFVGIESVTEKMQKAIGKKLDIEKLGLLTAIPGRYNMRFSLSFIVGFPEEDENDIREIFAYALKVKYHGNEYVQIKIHSLAPLTGSPLFDEYQEKLQYDPYGSIGSTDIPPSWTHLRSSMVSHPKIFSLYFHLPIGREKRINSAKYGYLGLMIDKLLTHSMMFAYEALGVSLADLLIREIDKVKIPPAASLLDSDYTITAVSLREIIYDAIQKSSKDNEAQIFLTLANYEICLMKYRLMYKGGDVKYQDFHDIIEIYFSPDIALKILNRRDHTTADYFRQIGSQKRYLLIFEKEGKLKQSEVPVELYQS